MTNLFVQFKNLTHKNDIVIGTIVAELAETSTLTDPYGQTFVAIGTGYAPTTKVFVKDGIIISEAPDLDTADVIIT